MSGQQIKSKLGFTLIELIIVLAIVGVVYGITASTINLKKYVKDETLTFYTLYEYLTDIGFENSISIKCDDEKQCFIFVDDTLHSTIENKLFIEKPTVYTYDKKMDTVQFDRIELENLENYDVVFEYSINKYGKTKDMIVEVDNKVYVFNSFNHNVTTVEYLSDVSDYFDHKVKKVRDAF